MRPIHHPTLSINEPSKLEDLKGWPRPHIGQLHTSPATASPPTLPSQGTPQASVNGAGACGFITADHGWCHLLSDAGCLSCKFFQQRLFL